LLRGVQLTVVGVVFVGVGFVVVGVVVVGVVVVGVVTVGVVELRRFSDQLMCKNFPDRRAVAAPP
jgi:hypothetical protein